MFFEFFLAWFLFTFAYILGRVTQRNSDNEIPILFICSKNNVVTVIKGEWMDKKKELIPGGIVIESGKYVMTFVETQYEEVEKLISSAEEIRVNKANKMKLNNEKYLYYKLIYSEKVKVK